MREIRLHDTRSGEVRALEPREPGRAGIYACGPTVYGRIHVGNARPYVVFALLKRFLEHQGLDVDLVVNITDINDKIYDAARELGVASADLAHEMIARYEQDTDRLGLGRPDHEPRATDTVGPIVGLIERLVQSGHAYAAGGDVFFRVGSWPAYGSLSHQDPAQMDQGEGIEGAQHKEDPRDFALWKGAKPTEDTRWPSPWGEGRPGWHIECSAMAEELLGLNFEIHGGGSDLVFPHHENEAAQSEAAHGEPLARLWVHNGMVQMGEEKMAKSVGNIRLLHHALDEFGRDALVAYFLAGHYRQPIAFSAEQLGEARARVARIREAARRLVPGPSPEPMAPLRDRFLDALADDFNTPEALAVVAEWVREANRRGAEVGDADLREMLTLLGLETLLGNHLDGALEAPAELSELVDRREQARRSRDFGQADALREQIRAAGWEVRDGPQGPELIRGR